jgi:hypothetical protein
VAAGSVAGSVNSRGYRGIKINGRQYQSSRLAFLYMRGEWPSGEIDHKNRDRLDNRFDNLRESSRSQNMANKDKRSDNTSGVHGVYWRSAAGRWLATIQVAGKRRHVGQFSNKYAAARAYDKAALEAWGEFAALNNLPHLQFKFDELMGSVQFLSAVPRTVCATPSIVKQANA